MIAKTCACGCGDKVSEGKTFIHGHNSKGITHPMWKGGRFVSNNGYIYVWNPKHPDATKDGYVLEHRLVMEKMIGRRLEPKEQVHHINGVTNDNRSENLMLLGIREHGQMEGKKAKGVPKFSARRINDEKYFREVYYNKNILTKNIAKLFGVSTVCIHDTARRMGLQLRRKTGNGRVELC